MDNIIKVVCPTPGCNAILSFKAVPNYQKLSLTCPMCKERHKYAECKPFNTPSKPAEQQDQTEIVNQDETQIISRVKICCLDTREEYVLNPGKNIIGRVANPPQAEILFKDESRYMGRRHAEINVINQGAQVSLHIKDLSSKNGTFVKGVKISEGSVIKLPLNTEFVLGRSHFVCKEDKCGSGATGHEPTEII